MLEFDAFINIRYYLVYYLIICGLFFGTIRPIIWDYLAYELILFGLVFDHFIQFYLSLT